MPNPDFLKTALGRLFDPRKSETALRLVATLGLVLLVARTGADLTWQLSAPLLNRGQAPGAGKVAQPQFASQPRPAARPSGPAEEIALFGQATINPPAAGDPSATTAPATSLNLVLKGVVAVRPMRRALAVIAERGANEQLYGQGEALPGNAVLREIHPDKIIISRNGVLETLFLDSLSSQPAPASPQPPSQRTATATGNAIRSRGDGLNWQITQDYWQERLADLPGLAKEIGVEVYKENDQQRGYRLLSSPSGRLLGDLGLQTGDILLSVNGRGMNSIQEGLAIYQQVKGGGQISIEINRAGHRETRTYNVGG